jgi:hypothetical protein
MTKPLSQEQKEARESERSATKGKPTAKSPVTIETAIADLDKKFDTFIKNVGHGTFSEMVQEVRKLQKDGVFTDRVEAVIQLKLGKEGLKLTMGAKSNVTKKVSHKEDWGSIESNPAQLDLPMTTPKDAPTSPVFPPIESGEINPGSFRPSEDPIDTEDASGEDNVE